jgi:glucoamylase
MLRVPLSLAVLLSALFALTAVAEAAETWEPADKQGFGTAHDVRSKVWFTLGPTGMGEAYWPRIDRPAVRSLDLKVGGRSESDLATGQVTPADPRSLTPRQVVTARDGAWRITKTYVTDPARDVVLVDMDVRSLNGRPLHLSTDLRAGLDKDRRAQTALLARPALRGVDGVHSTHVTLALGLGRTKQAAEDAASASLQQGFPTLSASYAKGWHDYLDSLPPRPAAAAPYAALYDTSLMVLAASEDKTYRGASVASPSMPWAWGQNTIEKPSGVYHLVWSRDLYQVATAQLAAGDRAAAERSLDFLLFRQQKPDGSFPQNSEVDGTEHWKEIQMDQVGMPIVLAWQLGRTDARTLAKVRLAGEYLVKHGPLTGQERWENQRGWSPATIAAEIAGLVTGADLLRRTGDAATAARWEATADAWQRSVQAWTATTNGPLSTGPYYLRVTKDRAPNRATTYNVGDSGPSAADQRRVVDPSFLDLVRLGVKPASDPVIENSVRVVDDQLKVTSRLGTFWHRFSYDGYGETSTGEPWEIGKPDTYKTYGRAWPLLAGERGEYELASGRPATQELASMAVAAGSGLMLPEQVWDGRPPSSGAAATPGRGTLSATPLAWSHAQFVRLALSIDAGAPVERPAIVACRYAVVCRSLPPPDVAP